jgi:hypothetical protein
MNPIVAFFSLLFVLVVYPLAVIVAHVIVGILLVIFKIYRTIKKTIKNAKKHRL